VAVVTKKEAAQSATNFAQGGIAAVVSDEDSFESHAEDTMNAGAGLCHEDVVRFVVERGRLAIEALGKLGVEFDRQGDDASQGNAAFALGREGGHTVRRVLHHRDATGREIERALLDRARAHPNITLLEDHCAIDLLTTRGAGLPGPNRALGAYVLDAKTGNVERFRARATFLATGGAGKVYLYTSNPDIATGDGMAMAYRAGAALANMEFFQFHPTCLYHPQAKSFLISEALRGEGALLRNEAGVAFMEHHHPMKDLAPRDIVARAIDDELKRSGNDSAFLDITHRDADFLRERFPNIYEACLDFGIDMTREPIPVVPAAHYCCGGVVTDLSGETEVKNLFAGGEVACTGLHGANRLASNSLLEGAVFAEVAAEEGIRRYSELPLGDVPVEPWKEGSATESSEAVVITQNWDEIRRLMWNYVGIVRTDKRLARARRRIELLKEEINEYYWDLRLSPQGEPRPSLHAESPRPGRRELPRGHHRPAPLSKRDEPEARRSRAKFGKTSAMSRRRGARAASRPQTGLMISPSRRLFKASITSASGCGITSRMRRTLKLAATRSSTASCVLLRPLSPRSISASIVKQEAGSRTPVSSAWIRSSRWRMASWIASSRAMASGSSSAGPRRA
jgi:L-aspartate oxidase